MLQHCFHLCYIFLLQLHCNNIPPMSYTVYISYTFWTDFSCFFLLMDYCIFFWNPQFFLKYYWYYCFTTTTFSTLWCFRLIKYCVWFYLPLHPVLFLSVLRGGDEWAPATSSRAMPLSCDDLICPKFQPNIFDSSRCHDCLRQKHLHSGTSTGTGTAETPQQSLTVEKEPGQDTGPPPTLLPAPQAVERNTSAKTEGEGIRRVVSDRIIWAYTDRWKVRYGVRERVR